MKLKDLLNEDRFGHKITALGNQIYIQLDKMEQLLSGKEKNNYMRAISKFWKITKTAMEDEEQK
jgi:flagellar hook-associated protein FlgK